MCFNFDRVTEHGAERAVLGYTLDVGRRHHKNRDCQFTTAPAVLRLSRSRLRTGHGTCDEGPQTDSCSNVVFGKVVDGQSVPRRALGEVGAPQQVNIFPRWSVRSGRRAYEQVCEPLEFEKPAHIPR